MSRRVSASSSLATDLTLAGPAAGGPAGRGARRRPDDGAGSPSSTRGRCSRSRLDGRPSARHALVSRCSPTATVIPGLGVPTRLAVRTDARRGARRRPEVRAGSTCALPDGRDRLGGRRGARHRPGPSRSGCSPASPTVDLDDIAVTRVGGGTGRPRRARRGRSSSPGDFPAPTGACIPRATSSASARAPRPGGRCGPALVGSRPRVGRRTRRPGRWSPHRGRRTVPGSAGAGRVAADEQQPDARRSAARPEALVDGDEHTAWSPAPDDTSPEITLTLDEPADVDAVVAARPAWLVRALPPVRAGAPRRSRAAGPGVGGRPARRARTGRADGLGQRAAASRPHSASAAAALEVEELDAGRSRPRPSRRPGHRDPAAPGPSLEVDGTAVPTRLDGPRSALWGEGDLSWTRVRARRARPRRRPRRRRPGRRGAAPGHGAALRRGLRAGSDGSTTPVP